MSHVAGKNKKELQAMAKGRIEEKKGLHYFALMVAILILKINIASSLAAEQNMKEEYPFSPPKVKYVSCSFTDTLQWCLTPISYLLFNYLAELKTHKKVEFFAWYIICVLLVVLFTWS